MIRSGGIFGALRTQMLAAIPEGAAAPFRAEATIGDWLARGTYVVTKCSSQAVQLEASQVDFASVLLVELENLLNHCFEHLQELLCFAADSRDRSDAWAIVTVYYLGFFSASALLRLLGTPITFFGREQLLSLQQLAGAAQRPRAGAFRVLLGNQLSATQREITVSSTEKVHEATWKNVLLRLDALNRNPTISKRPEEADFYDSLCTTAFCGPGVGFDWPSSVRNRANYRPGYAYKLLNDNLHVLAALQTWRDVETADVFAAVRGAYRQCSGGASQFGNQVGMMITVAMSLFILARSLYSELLDRRKADRRWERQRNHYRGRTLIGENAFPTVGTTFA